MTTHKRTLRTAAITITAAVAMALSACSGTARAADDADDLVRALAAGDSMTATDETCDYRDMTSAAALVSGLEVEVGKGDTDGNRTTFPVTFSGDGRTVKGTVVQVDDSRVRSLGNPVDLGDTAPVAYQAVPASASSKPKTATSSKPKVDTSKKTTPKATTSSKPKVDTSKKPAPSKTATPSATASKSSSSTSAKPDLTKSPAPSKSPSSSATTAPSGAATKSATPSATASKSPSATTTTKRGTVIVPVVPYGSSTKKRDHDCVAALTLDGRSY